jgi:hypothetical protein
MEDNKKVIDVAEHLAKAVIVRGASWFSDVVGDWLTNTPVAYYVVGADEILDEVIPHSHEAVTNHFRTLIHKKRLPAVIDYAEVLESVIDFSAWTTVLAKFTTPDGGGQ